MMALTARSLGATEYAGFAVWWTVATLVGTSFGVFEAYLARLLVGDLAAGRDVRLVTGLLAGRSAVVVGGIGVLQLAVAPWLAERLFAGHLGAALLLPVFTALAAAQALQRGAATGRRNFPAIAAQLGTDGVLRFGLAAVLVATGTDSVTTLAVTSCAAVAGSLAVGSVLCRHWLAPPRLRGAEAAIRPLLYLLVGSVGPLLANNGSVPWLAGIDRVDAYTLGAFAGAVTLSRIPTQFVSAAFSPLLAHLAQSVEDGDERTFTHLRRSADLAAVALGLAFVAVFTLAGPWLLTVYLGPRYELGAGTLAVLAGASSAMFVAVVQQASLAALDRWSRIALSWGAGTATFVLVLLLPGGALLRATVAPLAAVLAALALMSAVRPRFGGDRGARTDDGGGGRA